MKKILFNISLLFLIIVIVTGCGNEVTKENNDNVTNNVVEKENGKCKAIECINLINPENTVEEINEIIGFKGELTDEKYNKYYWELSNDTGIEVTYYSSSKGTIKVDFDRNTVANKKVDFSKYDEIKTLLNSGNSLTYNDFVNKVGNVEGTLIEKSAYTKKYVWVNSDGGYLNASFSETSGKCTIVTGRV